MIPKPAKKKPKVEYETIHEHRECSAPMCANVVTHWAQPVGYTGPVYCRDHASMARTK